MSIKLGATVRQIMPAPIVGVVVKKQFVEATDSFQYMVESPDSDGDGVPQTRWFEESQIEATGESQVVSVDASVEALEHTARLIDKAVRDRQVIGASDVGNVSDVLGEQA
ncbi:MAG: hypothetical protein Q8N51_05790 [Gammaproteobacteria bacterium]|nr:hypothetical protein [Gammaproteobacteria bacterium]